MNTVTQKSLSPNRQFPCPSCGAKLEFNPKAGELKCGHCGWKEAIPQSAAAIEERSYEQYLQVDDSDMSALSATAMEVECNGCRAKITFEPPQTAGKCPFCGTAIVAQSRSAHPAVTPESLLPCTVSHREARDKVRKWLSSRWFAPNALKQLAQQEGLQGVYLPFWTYDSNTISHYHGERGEHYYVTETYTTTNADGKQVTETREVQHTRWYPASGSVTRWFDDVLIPATQEIASEQLHKLAPWDLHKLMPYDPAYLAGFKAQRYQVSLPQGFGQAQAVMAPVIDRDVRSDIGGDEQRVHNVATAYNAVTFKHILLPVWLSAYRYNNQQFQVMVNAQTGEVLGDRPYSAVKIALAIAGVVTVGLSVFLLIKLAPGAGSSHGVPRSRQPSSRQQVINRHPNPLPNSGQPQFSSGQGRDRPPAKPHMTPKPAPPPSKSK
jgi:ribosomal protein S27E